jgi:hypothetical protein
MPTEQQTSIVAQAETTLALPLPREGVELPEIVLSAVQQRAVELLARGEEVTKVAETIGVDRGTLYRWRNSNPNFIAVLNRWRGELQAETRDRVLALSAGAVASVAKSITEGDSKLGLRVLEKMGCLKPGPDSPVDPYAVFGIGLADEEARGPVIEGFRAVSCRMTAEQARRAPQLLALGVAMDNRRAGRATSPEILKMAGPLPEEMPAGDEQGECRAISVSHRLPEDSTAQGEASPADDHPATGYRMKSVLRVIARVVHRVDYR